MVVEVKVSGLAFDPRVKSHVVVLKEAEGDRVLPIWIGANEAQAIARELAGQRFQRPLTHDLVATLIEGLKARLARVVIADLRDNTFFANLIVERPPEVLSVDARPSDSIAVALRCKAPIFVDDRLLEHQTQPEKSEAEQAEELRRYLENLDPEDFGKYSP
jgi:uncharacterized protein